MADLSDFKFWLRQLECPESYSSEYVLNKLQQGILGLIWEDVPKTIRPYSEVAETRKNILLYKLKHEPKDALIQSVKNTVHLRNEKKRLDDKIRDAEEKWRQQEFLCRKKVNLLEKKRANNKNLEVKKEILAVHYDQVQVQIKNSAKMNEICNHLMPPTVEDISQSTITDCLLLVSNYSSSPGKRQIWNKIAELLTPIKIPVLWNALLQARSYYTDRLIHLDIEENDENSSKAKTNVDIDISNLCSEHLNNVAMRSIYSGRTKNSEEAIVSYIQKIDQIIEKERPDLNDWLPLTLEARKLEVFQNELQKEIEKLEEQLPVDTMSEDKILEELICEIKDMDSKTAECVQEIKKAFGRLRSSAILITKTRENLANELEKLNLLQTSEENNWLDIDPSNELIVFNSEIDINALRKITIKSNTGIYKHLNMCLNQVSSVIDIKYRNGSLSNFPMIRLPIYYLVDLYKTFIINDILSKRINEEDLDIQYEDSLEDLENSLSTVPCPPGILQLLRLSDSTCKRTLQHVEEFEQIIQNWSNQTVRVVVTRIFGDQERHGHTLNEWQRLFDSLVYILQKSNIGFV